MKYLKAKKYSMLSIASKFGFLFIFGISLIGSHALALCPDGSASNPCPDATAVGTNITTTIKNPLGDNIKDIPSFIKVLVTIVLTVGVPLVALAIIYSGFLFVTAQGNPESITKAKKALMYSLIGAALLLGAYVIAEAIQATVDQLK